MTQQNWEALLSLVVDEKQKGSALEALKNEEGEFLTLEKGLPIFKNHLKTRLDSRRDWGISQKAKEIQKFLVNTYGVSPKEGDKLEDLVKGLVEKGQKQEPLTREQLAENEIVKEMIQASSKTEITSEMLNGNPLVAEMIRNAVTRKESELSPQIEALQNEITNIRKQEAQARMSAWVSAFVDDSKLNYGEGDDDKKSAIGIISDLIGLRIPNVKWIDGDPVAHDTNGNPLVDDMGFPVPFKEKVLSSIPYKPHKYPQGQNSPQPPTSGRQQPNGHNFQAMSDDQFWSKYDSMTDSKKKSEFMRQYDEFKEKAGA